MDCLPVQKKALVIGTADTKLEELLFLKSLLSRAIAIPVLLVDVSAKRLEPKNFGQKSNAHLF